MDRITYATGNAAKVRSLRRRLQQLSIRVDHRQWTIPEPRLNRVEDIARFKAMFAFQELRRPILVNDSAFYIDSLRGFPGTQVQFGMETIDIDGMVRLAAGSSCHFRHVLGYYDQECEQPMLFADSVTGTIADRPRGRSRKWHWSRLCHIFIPSGAEKTLAEMSEAEWVTHRDSGHFGDHYAEQFATWYLFNRSTPPTLS